MQNLTGQSIGRYHIIEKLGEGGMAVVYKAFDTTLDCEVAVKVLRIDDLPPSTAERTLKRFKREAKETAQLLHPNIVRVTDFGEFEGAPFLVMPFVPGGTLKQMLQEHHTPMPYQEAAKLLAPIARALDSAHKGGVVHRDIKPANILITADGHPLLTDFGIAKILENDRRTTELTGAGMAIGTPEYMAPEQWTGKELDGRADIYSLGVVFYELITGRTPFSADTVPAVMVMALRDPLPRPRGFVKEIPDSVEQVMFKALAREPENRYQSMGEFANALDRLSSVGNTKPGKVSQISGFPGNRKWLFPIGGLLLVALVTTGIILWINNAKTTQQPTPQNSISAGSVVPSTSGDAIEQKDKDVIQTSDSNKPLVGEVPVMGEFHWEFEKDGIKQGWGENYTNNVRDLKVENGLLFLHSTGDDPYIMGPTLLSIDSTKYTTISLRMKVSKVSSGLTGQFFFITDKDKNWDESKQISFDIRKSGDFEDYLIDVSKNNNWKGIITSLRIDPTENLESDVWIDHIRLDPSTEKPDASVKTIAPFEGLLPVIPIYDSFDGDQVNLTKWSEPPWGNPKSFAPKQSNGELLLTFDDPGSWRDWSIPGNKPISKMYALLSLEKSSDTSAGLSLRGDSFRYEFLYNSRKIVIFENSKNWNELESIVKFGDCCSTQHLIGAEASGSKITFFFDGKLIKTYPISSLPDYGGLQISGDAASTAHIDSVWVEFTK